MFNNFSRKRRGGGGGRGGGKKRWIGDYYTGRMYGWFRCSDCDKNWESSNVYMKKSGEYWTQQCKECDTAMQPYKAEPIRCSNCGEENCTCNDDDFEGRHIDADRPHLSHLCARCKSGRPCRY